MRNSLWETQPKGCIPTVAFLRRSRSRSSPNHTAWFTPFSHALSSGSALVEIGEAPVPRPYGRRKARRRIGEGTSNPQPQRASKLLRSRVCFAAGRGFCSHLSKGRRGRGATRLQPSSRQTPAARSAGPRPCRERAEVQARARASSPYNLHKTKLQLHPPELS